MDLESPTNPHSNMIALHTSVLFGLMLLPAVTIATGDCTTDLGCSLNGVRLLHAPVFTVQCHH
jgi:hypothetical protein